SLHPDDGLLAAPTPAARAVQPAARRGRAVPARVPRPADRVRPGPVLRLSPCAGARGAADRPPDNPAGLDLPLVVLLQRRVSDRAVPVLHVGCLLVRPARGVVARRGVRPARGARGRPRRPTRATARVRVPAPARWHPPDVPSYRARARAPAAGRRAVHGLSAAHGGRPAGLHEGGPALEAPLLAGPTDCAGRLPASDRGPLRRAASDLEPGAGDRLRRGRDLVAAARRGGFRDVGAGRPWTVPVGPTRRAVGRHAALRP